MFESYICLKCTENLKIFKKNVFLKMNTEACQGETTYCLGFASKSSGDGGSKVGKISAKRKRANKGNVAKI